REFCQSGHSAVAASCVSPHPARSNSASPSADGSPLQVLGVLVSRKELANRRVVQRQLPRSHQLLLQVLAVNLERQGALLRGQLLCDGIALGGKVRIVGGRERRELINHRVRAD